MLTQDDEPKIQYADAIKILMSKKRRKNGSTFSRIAPRTPRNSNLLSIHGDVHFVWQLQSSLRDSSTYLLFVFKWKYENHLFATTVVAAAAAEDADDDTIEGT